MPKYFTVRKLIDPNDPTNIKHKLSTTQSKIISLRSYIHNFLLIPEDSIPFATNVGLPSDFRDIEELKEKMKAKFSKYGEVSIEEFMEGGQYYIVIKINNNVMATMSI